MMSTRPYTAAPLAPFPRPVPTSPRTLVATLLVYVAACVIVFASALGLGRAQAPCTGCGGGALSSIETINLSGSTADFSNLGANCRGLWWKIEQLTCATDNCQVWIQVGTAGGVQTSNYDWRAFSSHNATTTILHSRSGTSPTAEMTITAEASQAMGVGVDAGDNVSGDVWLEGSPTTANFKNFKWRTEYQPDSACTGCDAGITRGSGAWLGGTDALTSVRFGITQTGGADGGSITLYCLGG